MALDDSIEPIDNPQTSTEFASEALRAMVTASLADGMRAERSGCCGAVVFDGNKLPQHQCDYVMIAFRKTLIALFHKHLGWTTSDFCAQVLKLGKESRRVPTTRTLAYRLTKALRRCDACGAQAKLKRCERCNGAHYCGVDCQRTHWRAGHKAGCVPTAYRRVPSDEAVRLVARAMDLPEDTVRRGRSF